jgi:hypothetical protein
MLQQWKPHASTPKAAVPQTPGRLYYKPPAKFQAQAARCLSYSVHGMHHAAPQNHLQPA